MMRAFVGGVFAGDVNKSPRMAFLELDFLILSVTFTEHLQLM
jgi:hypothetical protein